MLFRLRSMRRRESESKRWLEFMTHEDALEIIGILQRILLLHGVIAFFFAMTYIIGPRK